MASSSIQIFRDSSAEVAALRKALGLSQEDLAERSGVHPHTVSNLERAAGNASALILSAMLVQLGCQRLLLDQAGFHPVGSGLPHPWLPSMAVPIPSMARIIGRQFAARRRACELTLAEVAQKAGLHLNTVWSLERGLAAPSVATLYHLARALEIGVVWGAPEGIRLD